MENIKLKEKTLLNIAKIGFNQLKEVQLKTIPLILSGRDLVVKSVTGSGKTHSYLIPLFDQLSDNDQLEVLILSPTRELAEQIYKMAKQFDDQVSIKIITGGKEVSKSSKELNKSKIIVATPGKLLELLNNQTINLKSVKRVVLDEVDMILENCFKDELNFILKSVNPHHQTLTFSASINKTVKGFLKANLRKPELIELSSNIFSSTITHNLIPYRTEQTKEKLLLIAKKVNPLIGLVFASNIDDVVSLYNLFLEDGLKVAILHSKISARERAVTIKRIKLNQYQFVICSDVISRGIDIEGVSAVFNYDIPNDITYFFHRLGRTGRNNQTGDSYTFYQNNDLNQIRILDKSIKFVHCDFKGDHKKILRPLIRERKTVVNHKLNKKIKEVVNRSSRKVKPNYKKKRKLAIEKVKKEHKRKIRKENIISKKKEAGSE